MKENKLGAFVTRCDIHQCDEGILADYDIVIKDNIAIGGIPMTCGSPTMLDHRPEGDVTVVKRLLNAGGRIIGKTTMNEFAMGGDEEIFRFTLPRNPHNAAHRPGGSSVGSAIAVANGDANVALGTDTAASVRCPAAYCGIVGLKSSKGAVSHHGVFQFAKSLDS